MTRFDFRSRQPEGGTVSDDRGARVLDAAGELLVAHGYRRVTIADVAERAGVGKGTVYLHWPSKLDLFAGVLVREGVAFGREHVAALRADPGMAQLHRTMSSSFRAIMRRPLSRALYTGDRGLLGALLTDTAIGRATAHGGHAHQPRQLALLHHHGLLVDDPAEDPTLGHRLTASTLGFFLLGDLTGGDALDLDQRADALALVVRRAFEPEQLPGPDALARAARELADFHDARLAAASTALPTTTTDPERP